MWVLVDVSYLAYRSLHTIGNLAGDDGPTGVLFGFFTQIRSICDDPRVGSNRLAIFFDSRKSYRHKTFPEYKKGRRKEERTPEEWEQIMLMRDQLRLLRSEILPAIGIPVYRQTGLESDDLIAYAASIADRAVMVTADGDLYQCIRERIHWWNPAGKYHTPATFREAKGIEPEQWGEVKAIAGCIGDEVPGVPGVGEKSAVMYLTDQLPSHYKRYHAITSPEGIQIRRRNRGLVVLPHAKTRPFDLREPEFNVDAFFHYCETYGLLSFLQQRRNWESFFRGRRGPRRRKSCGR